MKRIILKFLCRGKVLRALAFAGYYLGFDRLFYWLNRRAKRILTFHNVLPDDLFVDDGTNGVSCSASDFRAVIEEVARRFPFSTDLADATSVTLTFDDGYVNQYEIAARILGERDIPAILFACGSIVGTSHPDQSLVVDRLLFWKSYAPKSALGRFVGGDMERPLAWGKVIRPRYADDSKQKGLSVVNALDAMYPFAKIWEGLPKDYLRLRLTGVGMEQVENLKKRHWIVGWHTGSHYPLSSLACQAKVEEMRAPEWADKHVFSYPYGEEKSVAPQDIELAKDLGYDYAVSNMESPTAPSRYFLPRMSLSSDKILLHFKLSGFFHFCHHLSLLPVVKK